MKAGKVFSVLRGMEQFSPTSLTQLQGTWLEEITLYLYYYLLLFLFDLYTAVYQKISGQCKTLKTHYETSMVKHNIT